MNKRQKKKIIKRTQRKMRSQLEGVFPLHTYSIIEDMFIWEEIKKAKK